VEDGKELKKEFNLNSVLFLELLINSI